MANYGLRILIKSCRACPCPTPGCDHKPDQEPLLEMVNHYLDPFHKLEQAALDEICRDLDERPNSHIPTISASDEKDRNDGVFEHALEDAFKTFRDEEREILLNVPAGPRRDDDTTSEKWWIGAAHMRHYLEFLFVLEGLKPCVLFLRNRLENCPIFSTIVIDTLVPIMNRLDLWSYGFRLGFQSGEWVFYDGRSPAAVQVNKLFLTDPLVRYADNTGAYPEKDKQYGVPNLEAAHALGYPVHSDGFGSDRWIIIRDATELDVLVEDLGWPAPYSPVQGLSYTCAAGDDQEWTNILVHYFQCEQAAAEVGTGLQLFTFTHTEITAWLEENPGILEGPTDMPFLGVSGPKLHQFMEPQPQGQQGDHHEDHHEEQHEAQE
ncbi:hypothetical protein Daus18300_006648 [Diaporthe australafricana]|uniref:Uncharacterized protein n=1 Tax=Diaporthe australafricana TaxID=127596 RepID=A0ABR3WTQ4_9PEZI